MPIKPWKTRLTLEFVEEGGITSCKVETSGALKKEQDTCGFFIRLSGGPLAKVRADAGYKRRRTIFETSLAHGTEAPPAEPPNGMELFARQVARLSVDETGKPLGCRVIDSEGSAPQSKDCEDLLLIRFERPEIKIGAIEVTVTRNLYISEHE